MEIEHPGLGNRISGDFKPVTQKEQEGEIKLENGEQKTVEVITSEQKKACADQCANVIKWVAVSVAITGAVAVVLGLLVYFGPLEGVNGITSDTGFFAANAGFAATAIAGVVILIVELTTEKVEKEIKSDAVNTVSWFSCCNRKQEKTDVEPPQSNESPIVEKTQAEEVK